MGISVPIWPFLAHSQAVIVSEREPIVIFDEADLNPATPEYEWEGASLLKNIRVIDGTGVEPAEGQDLVVADGKITAVGPTGSLDVPSDVKVIDGDGLTVLPGLIDAHMHLSSGWRGPNDNGNRPVHVKWQLLNFLYAGVTQVYDIGSIPDVAGDTRDMVEAGAWMGPDIKIAGTYFETAEVGAPGYATLLLTNNPSYLGGKLDSMKNVYGVEMVKCHAGINIQVLRAFVAEAHKRGMRVVCDLWQNNGNPWIANVTKLDGYAHNMFMTTTPTQNDANMLKDLGTFIITTTVMVDTIGGYRIEEEGDFITGNSLIVDVNPPHWIEQAIGQDGEESANRYMSVFDALFGDQRTMDQFRSDAVSWTKMLVDTGVLVGVGTDTPYLYNWSGESLHRELELWVNEVGISPIRTLKAATSDNAKILKIDDRTGSIQVGLEGDLLVVEGNPADNISDTRNIRHVFNNGKLVNRESLTRQWKM
ncbi:amidohydrolase family protein [Gammaproteobacteria bacterium]|nr:amidohydrolase family protein [Gammaproteobacteria bacterium]